MCYTNIARATDRAIRYVPISTEQYASALSEAGLPADEVKAYTALFNEILDGRSVYLADDVESALGRAPRDFSDYARDTVSTGVWDVVERD